MVRNYATALAFTAGAFFQNDTVVIVQPHLAEEKRFLVMLEKPSTGVIYSDERLNSKTALKRSATSNIYPSSSLFHFFCRCL